MQVFRFRLERARRWQQDICAAEEDNLRIALGAVAKSAARLQAARAEAAAVEEEVRCRESVNAFEIRAWANYRIAVAQKITRLLHEHGAEEAVARMRREVFGAAKRRLELMNKIRDREFAAYRAAEARELEDLAQETFANSLHRKEHRSL